MSGREQRGQEIAAKPGIRKTPPGYIVPSQSGQGKYAVTDADALARCTCVISQNLSPRGFSKPFHHPEGRRSFSAYGILSTLSKSFSA